jgi:hypothetical protein
LAEPLEEQKSLQPTSQSCLRVGGYGVIREIIRQKQQRNAAKNPQPKASFQLLPTVRRLIAEKQSRNAAKASTRASTKVFSRTGGTQIFQPE